MWPRLCKNRWENYFKGPRIYQMKKCKWFGDSSRMPYSPLWCPSFPPGTVIQLSPPLGQPGGTWLAFLGEIARARFEFSDSPGRILVASVESGDHFWTNQLRPRSRPYWANMAASTVAIGWKGGREVSTKVRGGCRREPGRQKDSFLLQHSNLITGYSIGCGTRLLRFESRMC